MLWKKIVEAAVEARLRLQRREAADGSIESENGSTVGETGNLASFITTFNLRR
jgi:hypothetical protein